MNWILDPPRYLLSIVSKNINELIVPNYDNFLICRHCKIYQGIVLLIIHLIYYRIRQKTTIKTIWPNLAQLPRSLRFHTLLRPNIPNRVVYILCNNYKNCEWTNWDQIGPISSCLNVYHYIKAQYTRISNTYSLE